VIFADLFEYQHPDGVIRLSTLTHDWTDPEGRVWLGGSSVLDVSPRGPTVAADGGSFTVRWNGASAALLAAALDGRLSRVRVYAASVTLADDGQTRTAGPFGGWAGIAEQPEIDADPSSPSITITVQSFLIDLGRARPSRLSQRAVRQIDAGDTGGDFIETLVDAVVDHRSDRQ